MGLSACQRRTLRSIEHALEAGEPRLRSMYAMFARLNLDEVTPRHESLGSRAHGLLAWFKRAGARLRSVPGRAARRCATRLGMAALVSLIIAATVSVGYLATGITGRAGCGPAAALAGPARAVRAASCRSGQLGVNPLWR
jgi:hypothetical protein